MQCPKCEGIRVRSEVPALAKASVCPSCGWFEIGSVVLESSMTTYEKMLRAEMQRTARDPIWDHRRDLCLLCAKTRDELKLKGLRLILGIHGGICEECVRMAQDVLASEGSKPPSP